MIIRSSLLKLSWVAEKSLLLVRDVQNYIKMEWIVLQMVVVTNHFTPQIDNKWNFSAETIQNVSFDHNRSAQTRKTRSTGAMTGR